MKAGASRELSMGKDSPSILLVDDEEYMRRLAGMTLQQAGYEVVLASTGAEALARIQEATPDLIVSDVMMPDMDGLSLLRQLRADAATRSIPVILVTAMARTEDVVAGLELGADDYLVKPYHPAELVARVRAKINRPPIPGELLIRDRQTGMLSDVRFQEEVRREKLRVDRGGSQACLAYLSLYELDQVRQSLGVRAEAEIARQMVVLVASHETPLDLAGRDRQGRFMLLMPDTAADEAEVRLKVLSDAIVRATFEAGMEKLRLTPAIGYTDLGSGESGDVVQRQAVKALSAATLQLDLKPVCYAASLGSVEESLSAEPGKEPLTQASPSRAGLLALEIALTIVLGWGLPFLAYFWLDSAGMDISRAAYLGLVVALSGTAAMIWIEGLMSLRTDEPPEAEGAYPPASAIVAAYLPNEASTILATIDAFLRHDYPGELQVILAYNTPQPHPLEASLKAIAQRDPRFLPLRVEGSTSKAQNVNAALAAVHGMFVGIFDADHHLAAGGFARAWRWLSHGYDVVQGHCLIRNGAASAVARMVAVEFEAIYAVSHPGRARLYQFAIFGGSNGFWRTEALRQVRMHAAMLTEDIDASIRAVGGGARIRSDPGLISTELAPATWSSLWSQRLRWAQGWFQVSLRHLAAAMVSSRLSARQKVGMWWLLGWREAFPWVSIQIFPLITFWAIRYGGLQNLDWVIPVFVLATLFTLSTGPGQTAFAYLRAAPEIRQHRHWFLGYLLASSLYYTEFKNQVSRVSQLKELFGERAWRVTPRDEEPPV
jgi:DNA-binding response OmpR family regulator/cellulose synthase/poly-beta-1,6-N-acetylglucosamine synthase-like glycosyltransferase